MNLLIPVLAIALVAAVLALSRERRWRRALEQLLRIILARWRAHEDSNTNDSNTTDPDSAGRLR